MKKFKFNFSVPNVRSVFAKTLVAVVALSSSLIANAFCGFFVAKADAKLFNNKSEVILVRDGNKTVITMSNDFQGDMRDFAMVVPVPTVLKEGDIKVVERGIFDKLDLYSAPRLAEYYDNNPCWEPVVECLSMDMSATAKSITGDFDEMPEKDEKKFGVKIEAKYTIGEYDILILSAKESTGLKDWLTMNGYKIPETAAEVLQPYVKSNTKFFVVKVNLDKMQQGGYSYLRPIQIKFEHEKFMLPIRLGMANSQGTQDMIVYAFTRTGRVECTNYRTVKMPTDRNVPLFVKDKFGQFYKDLFGKTWRNENSNAVFLEYAWDVSRNNSIHCDPCVGPPPMNHDFVDAGVDWMDQNGYSQIFFTRMHVRYSKSKFPSDLWFQVTPNRESYQCRYVITHPATGDLSCDEGQSYLEDLQRRRKLEVDELNVLTGWYGEQNMKYMNEFKSQLKARPQTGEKKEYIFPVLPGMNAPASPLLMFVVMMLFAASAIWLFAKRLKAARV